MLLLVAAYGVVDELHQGSTPGRNPSPRDLLTDLCGAACVLWVAAYVISDRAREGGLRARLALGVLGCIGVALLATLMP